MIINRIKQIFRKVKNAEPNLNNSTSETPYHQRWNILEEGIQRRKNEGDIKNLQILQLTLQWLKSIRQSDYDLEVAAVMKSKNADYWLKNSSFQFYEGLNNAEIYKGITEKYTAQDFIPPNALDLENERHKTFAIDISARFETILRNTQENNSILTESILPFPKFYITYALKFFAIFCDYETHYIEPDYLEELALKVENCS